MKRILLSLLAALLALCSCSTSDKKLVQKADAYATYYQDSYLRKCVDVVGPPTCQPCRNAINDAANLVDANGKVIRVGMVPLATRVDAIGPLPKKEVEELKDLIKRLEECP